MFIINYFYELPEEIQVYIKKIKSVNTIIYKYKKYSEYMESILHFVDKLEFRRSNDTLVVALPNVYLCCLLLLGLKTTSVRVGWENILTITFRSLYKVRSRNFTLNKYEKMVYRRTYNYANKLCIKLKLPSSYCNTFRLQLQHEFSCPHFLGVIK